MIFCFSGTGNSKAVAHRLAELLADRVVNIGDAAGRVELAPGERVVWCFPVHSWGLPLAVRRFIREVKLRCGDDNRHFMVCTCGDDTGYADRMWRKELRRRGWRPVAAHSVIMPNTYVALPGFDVDPKPLEEEKLSASSHRIAEIAHAVKCGSNIDSLTRGKFPWLKTRVIYPLFMRFLTSPRRFRVSDKCVGCGKCVKACPLQNVWLAKGRPNWGANCTLCLACYHSCPVHAINYTRQTRTKGQYLCPLK